MLKSLYEYAKRMNLVLPAGYKGKTIKAFLMVNANGEYAGLRLDDGNSYRCPDIGSLANATDKCNLLVEKRSVVLPAEPSVKFEFFKNGLKDFSQQEPLAELCLRILETPELWASINEDLDRAKVKPSDRISFLVTGNYLAECDSVHSWWSEYRRQFFPIPKPEDVSLCLITGQPTVPMATVPKTTGLSVVGGHASGDALICFDKNAFCSYGLKKSNNAPVSEEAFSQVGIALDSLLKDAPILAGMKFVHWYDKALPREQDPLTNELFAGMLTEEDSSEETPEDYASAAVQARRDTDRVVGSVSSGEAAYDLPNMYYILLLSGVGGRIMVRQFGHGSYEELKNNLDQWNADLSLVNRTGTGSLRPVKLTARMIHLLKFQKNDRKVFDRLGKELSGISPVIISSILNRWPIPDSVASRALSYIRSQMLTEESENGKVLIPDAISCQWLKVWLIRNQKEVSIMSEYNPAHPDAAYHCGALMAVYAALQQRAYPDVNVTVVQRFFASAMQTPGLVISRMAALSTHHLAKLTSKAAAKYYSEKLAEVGSRMGKQIPTTLALAQQSLFVLGYYQMSAALVKESREQFTKTSVQNEEE